MQSEWAALTDLCHTLADRLPLPELLRGIVETAASLLATQRVSIRLLDASGTQLLATCRAGAPLHFVPSEFKLGEGLLGWVARTGEPLVLGDAERDDRFVPRSGQQEPVRSFIGVPLVSGRTLLGVLSATSPFERSFTEHHREVLTLLAGMCAPHVEMARLDQLARLDPLTGVLNRRGFDEVARQLADAQPLSLAMIDVDHFKRINDLHGHAVGDTVLRQVAQLIGTGLRADDRVARYGGEEFLLVLPRVGVAAAERISERVRLAVADGAWRALGIDAPVTVSVGVAERLDGETTEALVGRADAALYRAKHEGRNRVQVAPSAFT